jgi:hypothetical protein
VRKCGSLEDCESKGKIKLGTAVYKKRVSSPETGLRL